MYTRSPLPPGRDGARVGSHQVGFSVSVGTERLRKHPEGLAWKTSKGLWNPRPLSSNGFVSKVEMLLDRRVRPLPML